MRIKSVRIQNFRGFYDETIEFNDYTCFVGANGAGKSTVLCALNVLFRETRDVSTNLQQLQEEDFHGKNIGEPIHITVTFSDLSPQAQDDFKHYYRQGALVISAVATFDTQSRRAEVTQHGERLVMKAFAPYFAALEHGKLVAELKEIYRDLQAHFGLPAATTKDAMSTALRGFEDGHPEECQLIPSPQQFYGFSKGSNLLEKHLEWIYVPAVKDVTKEQVEDRNNTFGRLVARAVRSKIQFADDLKTIRETAQSSYEQLLAKSTSALEELSQSLQQRVSEWAHPDARVQLKWEPNPVSVQDPMVRILAGEGAFLGELGRFGHGLQRSYLLALLHELSATGLVGGPTLLLACEEPELYQHPPQARHLASVLKTLSGQGSQVVISTHSPLFVAGEAFEDVRLVRKDGQSGASHVKHTRFEEVAARMSVATGKQAKKRDGMAAIMHRALQPSMNEIFFASKVVLVEGIEDAAYIGAYLHLSDQWQDFRRRGVHIVSANCKSAMLEPLCVLTQLAMPVFVVFDADGATDKPAWRTLHEHDNLALLRALGVSEPTAFPSQILWNQNFVQWPDTLAATVISELGLALWQESCAAASAEWGDAGHLKKNPLHVGSTLRHVWDKGGRSASLAALCASILA